MAVQDPDWESVFARLSGANWQSFVYVRPCFWKCWHSVAGTFWEMRVTACGRPLSWLQCHCVGVWTGADCFCLNTQFCTATIITVENSMCRNSMCLKSDSHPGLSTAVVFTKIWFISNCCKKKESKLITKLQQHSCQTTIIGYGYGDTGWVLSIPSTHYS